MKYHVKDKNLRVRGRKRIEWAQNRMPVLDSIRKDFLRKKPLKDVRVSCCLHVTTETAVLMLVLKDAGAKVALCASNPLSTQDDVAASLVFDYGISVFAIKGENRKIYYQHIASALEIKPNVTMDDGADLVSTIHKKSAANRIKRENLPWGSTEETTTGVIRLKALERENKLLYPVIAVNDAYTKHLFDNRYGTGQSTIDGILRATNKLICGINFVVCGYGWCGRGVAMRAKGMGANVIVCETDPLRALEALMDGYRVMPLKEAVRIGDIFITVTGDTSVIRTEHFKLMKDKAIVANSGHFNVEIDLEGLNKISTAKKEVKEMVTEYILKTAKKSKRIYVLAQGRLVNLSCAEGHPAEVMDLSFANQALSCLYIKENYTRLEHKVYKIPDDIDNNIARLKLKTMGIKIDTLTKEQKKYLESWQLGT